MKFASFFEGSRKGFGVVEGDVIADLSSRFRDLDSVIEADADVAPYLDEAPRLAIADLRFDVPLQRPGKILCIGVNYPDRNEEYTDNMAANKKPSMFLRTRNSFVGHGEAIIAPPESPQFDYEGELVLVIGKSGRRIPKEQALDHIWGLTLCNEGSVRDWLRHAKFNVTQGKNWDRSGAIGPWVVRKDAVGNLRDLELATHVNGELRQEDNSGRLMFPFDFLIEYVSTFSTLEPGDMIVTGTPTGAGARFDPPKWLVDGDVVSVSCPKIGALENRVEAEVLA